MLFNLPDLSQRQSPGVRSEDCAAHWSKMKCLWVFAFEKKAPILSCQSLYTTGFYIWHKAGWIMDSHCCLAQILTQTVVKQNTFFWTWALPITSIVALSSCQLQWKPVCFFCGCRAFTSEFNTRVFRNPPLDIGAITSQCDTELPHTAYDSHVTLYKICNVKIPGECWFRRCL